jgi:hypothetical protein
VAANAREVVTHGRRDVDGAAADPEQAVENGGILVAEDGVCAAGQHRGHPPAAKGQLRVVDGVDAPIQAMKAAGADAGSDGVARVPVVV